MKKKSSSTGSEPSLFAPAPLDVAADSAPAPVRRKPRAARPRKTARSEAAEPAGFLFDCVSGVSAAATAASPVPTRPAIPSPVPGRTPTPTASSAEPADPLAPYRAYFVPPLEIGGAGARPAAKTAKSAAKKKSPAGRKRTRDGGWKDPCAPPPHPLGFRFLEEKAPLRATPFASVIPSVAAKYGFGRKLSSERFLAAWNAALETVFGADDFGDPGGYDDYGAASPGRVETFRKFTRPGSLRGGILRVEVASNLLANELQFQLPVLLAEMRARLPNEKLEQIKIVVH